jgi:hypothetical protein
MNFYVGVLSQGGMCVPYWNSAAMGYKNRKPEHFNYIPDGCDNGWLTYFEGLPFVGRGKIPKLQLPMTGGEGAPVEFRIPRETTALMTGDASQFMAWRKRIHQVYQRYIRPKKALLDRAVDIVPRTQLGEKWIAVHYRHPAHCCEQGDVFLKDYFDKIDVCLDQEGDARIYLATDNDLGVLAFKEMYGGRLVWRKDVLRTGVDNLLAWAYARGRGKEDVVGFINNVGYELHNVTKKEDAQKLGEDVLLDVLCICRCDVFVYTTSNLALAVSYMNPDISMIKV